MTIVPLNSANMTWLSLIRLIMREGIESAPRGQKIKELIGHQTVIDMRYPLITVEGRFLGQKFAAAEAAWILSGDNRVETIKPFSREIAKFSDDGKTFFGAYGPKIEAQLYYVVMKLVEDPDTRQAVLNIWRENPPVSKDIPCSLSVQFLVRNKKLHCIYTMRASDAWLGWVYDVFNFTMLSSLVLLDLRRYDQHADVELGMLHLNAGSQHLYERDFEKVELVLNSGSHGHYVEYPAWRPETLANPTGQGLVNALWDAASKHGAFELLRSATAIL
jgi:thymidylate synthase